MEEDAGVKGRMTEWGCFWRCFPLLHNKGPQTKGIHWLSVRFPGSAAQDQLTWVFCPESHKAAILTATRLCSLQRLGSSSKLRWLLAESLFPCWLSAGAAGSSWKPWQALPTCPSHSMPACISSVCKNGSHSGLLKMETSFFLFIQCWGWDTDTGAHSC